MTDNTTMLPGDWVAIADELPREGLVVDTIVHDSDGTRNMRKLRRYHNLWFAEPNGGTYVYYTPTHWKVP